MGKGKKSVKDQKVKAAAVEQKAEEKPPVDTEMEQVKNTIEFHTRSLDRLKTIRTGKRKILDIFRQSGEQLDKKLMEQLHERYNEFVCQESEILELLRRTMGLNNAEGNNTEADIAVNDLCAQIAETNAKLAQAKQKNDKLEREAVHRKTNVKEVEEQRDSLQNRVRRIQQENVNKKQTVLKLISILRENPEILDKAEKAANPEPGFSCIQAAQSTPGTSKEYDEISKHLESIKARRGRMNAIRERLSQVSAAQTMDDTYQSALKRLEALSTIRKTLEESAAETPEEETEPKTESNQKEENKPTTKFPLETKPPLTSTTSVQLVTDSDGDEEEEEEEEDEAVREVDKVSFKNFFRFSQFPHFPIIFIACFCFFSLFPASS
jgi:chromosome segregation ATPase